MAQPDEQGGQTLASGGADLDRGARISTAYLERQVKAYAVFESEVESLTTFNAQATVFFSIASALLAFSIGIWTNWAFAEKVTPEGTVLAKALAPLLCVVAIVFYALGGWNVRKRRKLLDTVASESKSPR